MFRFLPEWASFLSSKHAHKFSFFLLAVADILLRQNVAKILVGDPHQQIYSFRGATNAMSQVDATHVYYLTQVFLHLSAYDTKF